MALQTGDERYDKAARFWAKIFGINFVHGRGDRHSHGIPVRHQLVALLALAGGVIGQTLAMEGCSPSSWNPLSWGCSSTARSA